VNLSSVRDSAGCIQPDTTGPKSRRMQKGCYGGIRTEPEEGPPYPPAGGAPKKRRPPNLTEYVGYGI